MPAASGRARSPTALDRPKGLKEVVNPIPATGGANPETLAQARTNAPNTVKTFGRIVSLQDFEDVARASGEVAKARATWVWDGTARAIHLTVAGQQGGILSPDDLRALHSSLAARRDPNPVLLLPDSFVRVPIGLAGTIRVDPLEWPARSPTPFARRSSTGSGSRASASARRSI